MARSVQPTGIQTRASGVTFPSVLFGLALRIARRNGTRCRGRNYVEAEINHDCVRVELDCPPTASHRHMTLRPSARTKRELRARFDTDRSRTWARRAVATTIAGEVTSQRIVDWRRTPLPLLPVDSVTQ